MNKFIDIGVNLTGSSFEKDVPDVIERARQAGVEQLILTGTNVEHSEQAIELSRQYESVCYSTVGLHPHHASDYSNDVGSELKDMMSQTQVVAVGECGLDFNRNFSSRTEQIRAFEAQIEMAIDLNKPLFLHQRDAHEDLISIIKSCREDLSKIVVHCFTGNTEEVNDYNLLDMHIGITGWICDERRGHTLQKAVKQIPMDRIMLETDAPYLLPRDLTEKPVKKNRNEPYFLPHIANAVAQYMEVDETQLIVAALENTQSFFDV